MGEILTEHIIYLCETDHIYALLMLENVILSINTANVTQ